MKITVPEFAMVALVGASGSGKSTFARSRFRPTEVLSSDYCRGLVSDDDNDQSATAEAFDLLRYIAAKRLAAGKLVVVDATNVDPEGRKPLVALAREYHCLPVAIVFDLPEKLCQERNRSRPDRAFGPHVIRQQRERLRRSLRSLQREGFRYVFELRTPEEVEAAEIDRQPSWSNRKGDHGPFDIIGDVHGCAQELGELLARLGYAISPGDGSDRAPFSVRAPEGRKAIFLGDLVDRGPDTPGVLRLVMSMVEAGSALSVPGNHDMKLLRKLTGKNVTVSHGLAESLEQLEREPTEFRERVVRFLDGLVSHYVLDDGKLVVAHAGMKPDLQGRASGRVREFALFGETTGETDEYGLPVRYNWAAEYRGKSQVVYGHTPVPEAEWLNGTICIDTGCVFGGRLTALRYPERELVSVPAARVYFEPVKPLRPDPAGARGLSAQQAHDELLELDDVAGKRIVTTRLHRTVTIREENSAAALEAMSRFAANPKWLIYLPPTMSPCEPSRLPGLLEHPAEALGYYRAQGIDRVVCEEKHMGSRALVLVCRDEEATQRRFGVLGEGIGICYTRTGRRFFDEPALEAEVLSRVREAFGAAGLWDELTTDWALLDCELMPWSAKAQSLVREQYAAVGAAARVALGAAGDALAQAVQRGIQAAESLLERHRDRAKMAKRYVEAYRHYCWPVSSIDDLRLAPFHVLATEGKVHVDRDHVWHMDTLSRLATSDPKLLVATPYRMVQLQDASSVEEGIRWWEELTARGGEGMVVKPLAFVSTGKKGLVQPALKCRGPEYLRIIYGPEYSAPEHLERLRARGLSTKRSLALREFALGIEGLERFVGKEPLRRVHECVFGVLALECEPVDPRL